MKIQYILLLLVFATGLSFGQDLSGTKFCINPGHGGHDADDRYIPETGFWESESNLTKGLYLRDLLQNMGAEIVMTRTTNTSEDDLPLSQICEIANNHNVDYFHSIHSNGYTGKINYPLLLFPGKDDEPDFPAAKEMGSIMWNQLEEYNRTYWGYNWENVRGDLSFYGYHLGVLKSIEMPGTLSEGSFHDYIPESWRLMNLDYRRLESWLIARSFLQFNDAASVEFGIVNGVVRDNETPVLDYFFIEDSEDGKKPLNNITVTLKKGADIERVYQGDSLNNGFFMMDSVEAGTYTLIYEAGKYLTDSSEIAVSNGEITQADIYLQRDTSLSPEPLSYYPDTDDSVVAVTPFEVLFNFPMDTSTFKEAFACEPEASFEFEWSDDLQLLTATPEAPYQKATHYTITIDTTAQSKYGVGLAEPLQIDFLTKNRNRLNLTSSFPEEGKRQITPYPEIHLYFDAPLNQSTVIGNIHLADNAGNEVDYYRADVIEHEQAGEMLFSPRNKLNIGETYKVVIEGGIRDTAGIPLFDQREISFTVREKGRTVRNVLDHFENEDSWLPLEEGPETFGVNERMSEFTHWPYYKLFGEASAKLAFVFTQSNGVAHAARKQGVSFNPGEPNRFGIWTYGDLSGNILKYVFEDGDGTTKVITADTIDWAGWEMSLIPLDEFSGTCKFTGIQLHYAENGDNQGKLYFDDAGTRVALGISGHAKTNKPITVYPNPASNKLTFHRAQQTSGVCMLEIYNSSGKLIEKRYIEKSEQSFVWNIPEFLADGLYFYNVKYTGNRNTNSAYSGKFLIRK